MVALAPQPRIGPHALNRRVFSSVAVDTDGDGDIDAADAAPVTRHFVYGGQAAWQVLAEYEDGSAAADLLATHVYGLYIDELVETRRDLDRNGSIAAGASTTPQDGVETLYPLQDDLFTVYSVVDGTGTVRERYEYGDYGTPLFLDATGTIRLSGTSDIGQQHLFTGRLWVSLPAGAATHNGLYEYRHRWSNPTLGQFLQRDPLGYVDGMNVYAYVTANPANRLDPTGRCSEPPVSVPFDASDHRDCVRGQPCWYDGSPKCSDDTWCYDLWRRRVTAILHDYARCLAPLAQQLPPPVIGCIALCAGPKILNVKRPIIPLPHCVAACLLASSIATIMDYAACDTAMQENRADIHIAYCTCLSWKGRWCNKDMRELDVIGCPNGVTEGSRVPLGWRPRVRDRVWG